MRQHILSFSVLLFTAAVMAAEISELVMNSEHPCVRVKLSPEQISAIKDIVYKNSQVRAQDEANVKKAMLEVDHTLSSSTSTKAEAEKAQSNLHSALASLTKTVSQLDLSINYDVLQPNQREMGSLCSKSLYSFPPVTTNAVASFQQP